MRKLLHLVRGNFSSRGRFYYFCNIQEFDAFQRQRIPETSAPGGLFWIKSELFDSKKKPPKFGGLVKLGGRGGIRTRGRLLTYARFPGV